jgi:hypothetical protein
MLQDFISPVDNQFKFNFIFVNMPHRIYHRRHRRRHHHISVMQLGHLLTRSGLTYPEVSSKVCHDSFCQLENSDSLPWVIYYEAYVYINILILSRIMT